MPLPLCLYDYASAVMSLVVNSRSIGGRSEDLTQAS